MDYVGAPYSASLHRIFAGGHGRNDLKFFRRCIFSAGGRLESRIATGTRPICHRRGAAEKMGFECEGAGRIFSAHERSASEKFTQEWRNDRSGASELERPLSFCDCGTLQLRANRRRQRKDYFVDAQGARGCGVARRERCAGSNSGSVRFDLWGAQQRHFHNLDRGMPSGGWMFHESECFDGEVIGRRREGAHLGGNGFAGHFDGGAQRGHAETRGCRGSLTGRKLAGVRAKPRVLRTRTTVIRASGLCNSDWAGSRAGIGHAHGNDSAHSAIDPGESRSPPAGRPNCSASQKFSIFLCIAGPVRAGSVSKGDQPHAVCSQRARVRTKRFDRGVRRGDAPECGGVRKDVDEAPGSAGRVSRALPRKRRGDGPIRKGDCTMRDVILTDRGPKPIGPYSQAIRANGFLYVSGQVALDPKTGEMTGTDIRQQTERVLENVKGILEAAGSNVHHVVKTTVFLKDMNEFAAMNEVYAKYFRWPLRRAR